METYQRCKYCGIFFCGNLETKQLQFLWNFCNKCMKFWNKTAWIFVKISAKITKLPKFPRSNAATLQGFLGLWPHTPSSLDCIVSKKKNVIVVVQQCVRVPRYSIFYAQGNMLLTNIKTEGQILNMYSKLLLVCLKPENSFTSFTSQFDLV